MNGPLARGVVAQDIESRGHTAAVSCYHCGEEVPPGTEFSLEIDGLPRPMCCPGCRAVALLIADSGLTRFYEQRTAYSERPEDSSTPANEDAFAVYDDTELLAQFSRATDSGDLDARLLIGGVSCAACTWLIETSLLRLDGVHAASLNLAQARLDLRFDPAKIKASALFARIAALGYRVQPWHSSAQRDQARAEYRRDLRRLAVAGIGMMQVGMFAIALHAGDIQGIAREYEQLLRLVSLLVTGFIVLFSAREFFSSAWRHLRHGALVMDLPVALAIGIAYGASAFATLRGGGDVYFDSVVMFTFLLLLARFTEKRLRLRDTLAWQDAEQTLPDAVQVWRDEGWQQIPRRTVVAGQRILLRAGDTIPVDGVIVRGESAVREDSFSGEALPRSVAPGDAVFAGTLNREASLEMDASGAYADSRLAALQRSIEHARLAKPAIARLADRLASYFIAGVLLATTATGLIWLQLDASRAMWIALSVLVISCPCALSLATPASLANAASWLRRRGVLVYGENALETLAHSRDFLFDKTGTLTTGSFRVEELQVLAAHEEQVLLGLAAALQSHAYHPIASAFAGTAPLRVTDAHYDIGHGIRGRWQDREVRIGAAAYCREIAPTLPPSPRGSLMWIAMVATNEPLAWFGVVDELRSEAPGVIATLRSRSLRCELLTGDASPRARALGEALAFDAIHTGQSPDDKLARVQALQAEGKAVTMVGDGLNDAPVLQRSDVSIAVAGATDLARAQADFVIQRGDLTRVQDLHDCARRTRRIIQQNFAWALGYNLIGIPMAALGWIPPWAAALGMSASSLFVVMNSARLRSLNP